MGMKISPEIVAEVSWSILMLDKVSGRSSRFIAASCYGKLAALVSMFPENLDFLGRRNEANFLVHDYFSRHGYYD